MFRMSIAHLLDVGARNLDEESVEATCKEIMSKDDSRAFISNEYLCEIVKTAGKLAKIDQGCLLHYISQNVEYDVGDDSISYDRAKDLLYNCLNMLLTDSADIVEEVDCIGIHDEELEELGYGWAVDIIKDSDI